MTQIPSGDVELLKSLVLMPEEEIESVFAECISGRDIKAEELGQMRLFLKDKLVTASEKYVLRITCLIRLLKKEIVQRKETVPQIDELCHLISEASNRKRELEMQIEELKLKIRPYLLYKLTPTQHYYVRLREGSSYLKVSDKNLVPSEFLTPQPDKKKLANHLASTGEIVPGTELKVSKDVIIVKSKNG